jgi:hypothetical protein
MKILDQVDYEWDFYQNTSKVTGEQDDALRYPAAYLRYSRSHSQILLGTQSGLLGKIAVAAEKQEDEEEDNQNYGQKEKVKKTLEVDLQLLGRFHTAPITGIRELPEST